jgi:hypothetical protein
MTTDNLGILLLVLLRVFPRIFSGFFGLSICVYWRSLAAQLVFHPRSSALIGG